MREQSPDISTLDPATKASCARRVDDAGGLSAGRCCKLVCVVVRMDVSVCA